jgi:hypothetical protein
MQTLPVAARAPLHWRTALSLPPPPPPPLRSARRSRPAGEASPRRRRRSTGRARRAFASASARCRRATTGPRPTPRRRRRHRSPWSPAPRGRSTRASGRRFVKELVGRWMRGVQVTIKNNSQKYPISFSLSCRHLIPLHPAPLRPIRSSPRRAEERRTHPEQLAQLPRQRRHGEAQQDHAPDARVEALGDERRLHGTGVSSACSSRGRDSINGSYKAETAAAETAEGLVSYQLARRRQRRDQRRQRQRARRRGRQRLHAPLHPAPGVEEEEMGSYILCPRGEKKKKRRKKRRRKRKGGGEDIL